LSYNTSFNTDPEGGKKIEQEIRKKAISRYLRGEKPISIYTDLNRSKNWFFTWLKRLQFGDPNWFRDKSRAPLKRPTQISASYGLLAAGHAHA
jgi:hypothetical protein